MTALTLFWYICAALLIQVVAGVGVINCVRCHRSANGESEGEGREEGNRHERD